MEKWASGRSSSSGWRYLFAALALCLPLTGAAIDKGSTGCEGCHGDPKYFVQYQKLYRYYHDWLSSPHKLARVTCDNCHGGDPEANDMESAHKGILPVSDPRSGLYYRNQPDTCGECHQTESSRFRESDHFKGLQDQVGTPTCTTCHAAMNRKPYYRDMVEITCRVCHYENNPNDLPMVANRADEILHRLNIAKGYMNWTRTHYQSRGWPDDSQALVESLGRQYDAIIAQGHSFDLENTDQASVDLLANLKAIYQKTALEVEEQMR